MKRVDIYFLVLTATAILFLFRAVPERTCPAIEGRVHRLVSLSPSLTRSVIDCGAGTVLAGATVPHGLNECSALDVGTFILPNWEIIACIEPDSVILSREEGTVQMCDILSTLSIPCRIITLPYDFDGICLYYQHLADICGSGEKALKKTSGYRTTYSDLRVKPDQSKRLPVAFLVSWDPVVAACRDSHLGKIIEDAGGVNAFGHIERSYAVLSMEALIGASPGLIVIMKENGETGGDSPETAQVQKYIPGANVRSIGTENAPYITPYDYIETLRYMKLIIREDRSVR